VRTLITGDLHLSHNPRDEYRFAFMKWFADLALTRRPDRIIIAGDLTEEKDRHPSILVNRVVDHVHTLAKIAPVVVVEGNHDYKDEGHAFFRFLSRIPNTRWISKPTSLPDQWLLLPHTNNHKRDWGDIDLAGHPYLVCHQTFNGANVGFGRKLDGIPLEVLPRKSTTFCGDIHVPQEMGKLVYIGAPYHVDFGDDYKARVIECNDRGWVSVDTSPLPQKRSIKLTTAKDGLKGQHFNERDVVEIKVEVDDMSGWQSIRANIMEQAERKKLQVWAIKPVLMKHAVRRRHKVTDSQTDQQVLETFAKRHGLTDNTLATGIKLL
jgi:DNA repair exonuclease SbcCD nuclease subunit